MTQIVIAQYSRSAFQPAHKGALTKTRPDDMAAAVVKAVIECADVDPSTIEDVILGNATPEGEQGLLMGRLEALRAAQSGRVMRARLACPNCMAFMSNRTTFAHGQPDSY